MGNTGSSSGRSQHDDSVDLGYLHPQGVYTGPKDWNHAIVAQLICDRRLAPFYRPLEDYDEAWDDEQILAHRKEPPEPSAESAQVDAPAPRPESASVIHSRANHHKRPSAIKENQRFCEGAIYRNAVECPICFLYYPPNINFSRCCSQAICTECFVQIKRSDPTPTHLVSDPAACPYCMQENFGVVYTPPSWRAGIGSEGSTPPSWPDSPSRGTSQQSLDSPQPQSSLKRRRKSFGADSPEVVTTDQIRPDWETKLASVRAAVARRANRRIIMRQVGDRLVPVGITSGRVHALPPDEAQAQVEGSAEGAGGGGGRRSRRRQERERERERERGERERDLGGLLGVGLGGQDLEELMVMEAMRLSLLEHEEHQRKEREQKAKEAAQKQADGSSSNNGEGSSSAAAVPSPPGAFPEVSGSRDTSSSNTEVGEREPTNTIVPSVDPADMEELNEATRAWRLQPSEPMSPHGLVVSTATTIAEPQLEPAQSEFVQPEPQPEPVKAPNPPTHTASFASSIVSTGTEPARGSSYDVLPSSPDEIEGEGSEEPLLQGEVDSGTTTPGGSTDAVGASHATTAD